MVDGRWLMLPRHTQPERDAQAMLNQLQITCRRNRRLASNPFNPPSERPRPVCFVVETFRQPLLNLKHLPVVKPSNCES